MLTVKLIEYYVESAFFYQLKFKQGSWLHNILQDYKLNENTPRLPWLNPALPLTNEWLTGWLTYCGLLSKNHSYVVWTYNRRKYICFFSLLPATKARNAYHWTLSRVHPRPVCPNKGPPPLPSHTIVLSIIMHGQIITT